MLMIKETLQIYSKVLRHIMPWLQEMSQMFSWNFSLCVFWYNRNKSSWIQIESW